MPVIYNWSTTYPGAVDVTSAAGSLQAVVDGTHVVMASHVNSLATAVVALQGENLDLKATALNVPIEGLVTGVTATYVGAVRLRAGTSPTIRAMLGCTDPTYAASLQVRRFTTGVTIATLGGVASQPTERTAASVVVTADDWYEFYLYANNAAAVAVCNGVVVELPI